MWAGRLTVPSLSQSYQSCGNFIKDSIWRRLISPTAWKKWLASAKTVIGRFWVGLKWRYFRRNELMCVWVRERPSLSSCLGTCIVWFSSSSKAGIARRWADLGEETVSRNVPCWMTAIKNDTRESVFNFSFALSDQEDFKFSIFRRWKSQEGRIYPQWDCSLPKMTRVLSLLAQDKLASFLLSLDLPRILGFAFGTTFFG